MSTMGLIGLLVAFAGVVVSVVCLLAGYVMSRKKESHTGEMLMWGGHVAANVYSLDLTLFFGILF